MVKERIDPFKDEEIIKLSRQGHIKRYEKATTYTTSSSNVLDVGCGFGYGSKILAKHCYSVFAIDNSRKAIQYAKTNYKRKNITYKTVNIETDFHLKSSFDLITCFEVLEHLRNPEKVIKKFRNLLNKNGTLIISVPNGKNSPRNNPHHQKDYELEEIKEMLEKNGFEIKEIFGQYPLLGWVSEILRKTTNYNTNTDKEESLVAKIVNKVPFIPNIFSRLYKGKLSIHTARSIFFVSKLRK